MATYTVVFHGGPCAGERVTTSRFDKPPDFIRCRGAAYILDPRRSSSVLWYSFERPEPTEDAAYIRGRRDVLKAWSRLMRAMSHGTQREIAALHKASRRVRRSVR